MASFKINFASCRGLPEPQEIVRKMEEFGLAETEEFGVLNASGASGAAFGTLIRRTNMTFQRLDPQTREVTSGVVERVRLIPFGLFPKLERMEVYAGSASSIEEVGDFLASGLAMPVVTERIEFDVLSAIDRLIKNTQRFQLRTIRVTDYAGDSYMIGPYAPKFMDTEHGLKFLEQYTEALKSAQVRFAGPQARVNATLTPQACFSFSCHEDDQPAVQQTLRELL